MAKEIPYKSDELTPDVSVPAEKQSNNESKTHSYPSTSDGPDGSTQLALVPLHPAAKRQKLDAKQLPIVLGRTNLAAWWWKSCPCLHYCRLHCRPVAQNIRSLSKVMIQIDTAGRVHTVGKNPHLIAVTPEREDNILQVNDIINIGRRDREPWMRFQVVQKPSGTAHLTASAPGTTARTHAVPEPAETPAPATAPVVAPPAALAVVPQRSLRRQVIATKGSSSNNDPSGQATNKSKEAEIPTLPPPEWITTSNARKRKPRRGSSGAISLPNRSQSPPIQQQNQQNSVRMQEAASAATIARVQRSYVQANHNNLPTGPPRNRRRLTVESPENEMTPKKPSRRSNRGGSSRKGSNKEVESMERISGGTTTTNNGENNKRRSSHVHLVFQDFETSASLLRGNEIRRREESSINQATTRASSSDSVILQHHYGEFPPPRAFVADKSQLRLLSRNFAAALLGAVSPTSPNADEKFRESPNEDAIASQPAAQTQEQQQDLDTKPAAMEKPKVGNKRGSLALSSSEEYLGTNNNGDKRMRLSENQSEYTSTALVRPNDSPESSNHTKDADEPSMLSLPACASSSFEPGQGDMRPSQAEHETNDVAGLLFAMGNKPEVEAGFSRGDDESASSPPTCDPIMDLKPWQEMVEQEEEKGTTSSFRYALASLIIAKNKDRLEDGGKRGILWLPSLLGEDFKIEPAKDTTT